jgi:cellulose synthase/poly-beta-1,6-N-acetylglucosamine synthase-like glycosyltransferase
MPYPILGQFITEFHHWLNQLTLTDLIYIYWPLIIFDALRSITKNIAILLDKAIPRKNKQPTIYPHISLIIPAHNEEKVIESNIQAALEAVYPHKEIIVVDDGSTDRTHEIAQKYSNKGLIKLIHRDYASGSKSGALNYGILFAKGEIVITIDADTLLERTALMEIIKPFANQDTVAASGNVRILRGEKGATNLLVRLQAYEYLQSLELGRRFNSLVGTLMIISGAFGAFRLEEVKSLGEYSASTITEDFDMTIMFRKLNKRIVFEAKAVSWTFCPETWSDWLRQRIRWTRGQAETLWKHRDVFTRNEYSLSFVAAAIDMLLMDFALLFIRTGWLLYYALTQVRLFPFIIVLMFIIYLALELMTMLTAGFLSPIKSDLKKVYLVPIMVLFYRPLYALVRIYAYTQLVIKRERLW